MQNYGINTNATAVGKINNPDAGLLMANVYKELQWNDDCSAISIESAVLRLIKQSILQVKITRNPSWANKVDCLLHDRWDDKLSLHELAGAAQLHPVNLSCYFPKYFGCTIGEYRRKLKIEKALQLIMTTPHSLTKIAYLCGFSDQSHFTRCFKQLTGWMPKSYQKSTR